MLDLSGSRDDIVKSTEQTIPQESRSKSVKERKMQIF